MCLGLLVEPLLLYSPIFWRFLTHVNVKNNLVKTASVVFQLFMGRYAVLSDLGRVWKGL